MEPGYNTTVEPVAIKDVVVDLRFCFPQHPDDDDIEALSGALKELIETKQLKAQGVQWRGLRENPTRHLIHHALDNLRNMVQKRRASSVLPRISTKSTVDVGKPPPTPSPSSASDPEHLAPDRLHTIKRLRTTTPSFIVENSLDDGSELTLVELIP